MIEFKVGDKVRAPTVFPGEETVFGLFHDKECPIMVGTKTRIFSFTRCGRLAVDAPEPALFLVERPKTKRKVKVERWVSIFHHPELSYEFSCCIDTTEEAALRNSSGEPSFIKTVKFETEVEIDE